MGVLMVLPGGGESSSDILVSKREAARHFGISVRTLERYIRAGAPSTVVGGRRNVRIESLAGWLRRQGLMRDEGEIPDPRAISTTRPSAGTMHEPSDPWAPPEGDLCSCDAPRASSGYIDESGRTFRRCTNCGRRMRR
jgi:hypothetical protein